MTQRAVTRILDGPHRHLFAALVLRVWPLAFATWCTLAAALPGGRELYGWSDPVVTRGSFAFVAVLALVSAVRTSLVWSGAALATAAWTLMGRATSYAFDHEPGIARLSMGDRVLAAGSYALVTLATVVVYFVHARVVVERKIRA